MALPDDILKSAMEHIARNMQPLTSKYEDDPYIRGWNDAIRHLRGTLKREDEQETTAG